MAFKVVKNRIYNAYAGLYILSDYFVTQSTAKWMPSKMIFLT